MAQADARRAVVMKPLESMNLMPNQEFMKGEIAMAEFVTKLPQMLIDEADRQLKEVSEDETA